MAIFTCLSIIKVSTIFSLAKFAYNNTKNASTSYTSFELNCKNHHCVFYKKDVDLRSKLKSVKELLSKLKKLMTM